VAGSGLLHYRFNEADPYSTVPLTDLGGNIHEAMLPGCGPQGAPQFYFSAEGDLGSTVFSPPDAPISFYSMTMEPLLEVLMYDDFEQDNGWTVQNTSVTTGAFERNDPQATEAQPENDHSENGTRCYVTGYLAGSGVGSYDLDGGPTRLLSPVLNLSGGDAEISFWLWFYHSTNGTVQPLEIDITNNGTTWTRVANVTNNPAWTEWTFKVSEYVSPTSGVQMRFSANDNPNDSVVEALVDDFAVMRLNYDASLWASRYDISVGSRTVVDFGMNAGAGNGMKPYLMLGTLSGMIPGFTLPGGKVLPINWDALTDLMLLMLNTPVFHDFMGKLDASGHGLATLDTINPLDPVVIGYTAHFAYLLYGYGFVSNAVALEFVP